jgi:hypothetical protein
LPFGTPLVATALHALQEGLRCGALIAPKRGFHVRGKRAVPIQVSGLDLGQPELWHGLREALIGTVSESGEDCSCRTVVNSQ